jgi:6-phosphogluconate dehydrogenase
MAKTSYDIGMVGLGTMGRNLVLNIASNGFSVIGYDKDAETVALMEKAAEATTKEGWGKIGVAKSIGAFVQALDPLLGAG